MIRPITREKIKGYIEGFLETQLARHSHVVMTRSEPQEDEKRSAKGRLKPFHEAILPTAVRRISAFERSFSTALGTTFEECAVLLARDVHDIAERGYELTGHISRECLALIDEARDTVDRRGRLDFAAMAKRVAAASGARDQSVRVIIDVFIQTRMKRQYYFEIKSPKPNKGQGIEVTERLLKVHAILQKGPPVANTFFAMAYNPYGTRDDYKHSFALNHLDMKNQVVLQEEFWDVIAGSGTFAALLDIYREVGKEKGPQILKRLGYDF